MFPASMARFFRRRKLGDRIKPLRLHRFAVKFGLARRSAKVAVSERKKWSSDWPLAPDPWPLKFSRTCRSRSNRSRLIPSNHGLLEVERAIDHLVDALAETRVLESHSLGQRPEHFHIRRHSPNGSIAWSDTCR